MAQHGCGNSDDVIKTEWVEDGNYDILIWNGQTNKMASIRPVDP